MVKTQLTCRVRYRFLEGVRRWQELDDLFCPQCLIYQ